jgi:predicted nucleic acid-binding protein
MSNHENEFIDVVVDASIGVKWLVPESHSDEASKLIDPNIRRHVPSLFFTEVSQTLWKKVHKRQELTQDEGRETFQKLLLLPQEIHPTETLFELSFEIALSTGRTVYDCVYLALAISKGWRFVTADERLYNSLKSTKFEHLLIHVRDASTIVPKSEISNAEEAADDFVIPGDVVAQNSAEEIELIYSLHTNERLTDEHLARLSEHLEIEDLDLADSLVTDSGLVHLVKIRNLKRLSLRRTGIGNPGLLHLQALGALETLDLVGTYVTDEGLERLRKLTRLHTLYLDETETTEAVRAALELELPELRIVR